MAVIMEPNGVPELMGDHGDQQVAGDHQLEAGECRFGAEGAVEVQ